jgi:hypothetical protein
MIVIVCHEFYLLLDLSEIEELLFLITGYIAGISLVGAVVNSSS